MVDAFAEEWINFDGPGIPRAPPGAASRGHNGVTYRDEGNSSRAEGP